MNDLLRLMVQVSNNSLLTNKVSTMLKNLPREDQRLIEEWLRHAKSCQEVELQHAKKRTF